MLKEIIQFLKDYYNLDEVQITSNSTLIGDLGLTSFQIIEMCSLIEEKYKVEIEEEDLAVLETVGDFANYLESKEL